LTAKLSGTGLTLFRGERCLFSDLSFALNPGELLLLEGQNGSGKTSLMRAIAGLLEFESGDVHWDGNPVREYRQAFHGEMIWMAHRTGLKLDLTLDQLAGKEMTIGRWYLRQGHYNAAINRFRAVVERYQTTTHVPEALHRLTEAYLALGLPEEARINAAVLGHNYPGTDWYLDSYALLTDRGVQPPESEGFSSSTF